GAAEEGGGGQDEQGRDEEGSGIHVGPFARESNRLVSRGRQLCRPRNRLIYSAAVTSTRRPDLSMVMPTYNESDRLAELTEALFTAARAADLALELIFVDDISPDGTGQIAVELVEIRRMQVVQRSGKLGCGTAVVAGFDVAVVDTVGVMVAVFSHPLSHVP